MKIVALVFLSSLAWVSMAAAAKPPPIDVSNDNIVCRTMFGTASFNPALTLDSADGQITVKGTLDGCTDPNNSSVIITASTFSGKIDAIGNSCTAITDGLQILATGTVTIKWKTAKTTPIAQKSTTLTISAFDGTIVNVGSPVNVSLVGHLFQYSDITGAFTGGTFNMVPCSRRYRATTPGPSPPPATVSG